MTSNNVCTFHETIFLELTNQRLLQAEASEAAEEAVVGRGTGTGGGGRGARGARRWMGEGDDPVGRQQGRRVGAGGG